MDFYPIPLDKAKYLSREMNFTVHAGGPDHQGLNNAIAAAEQRTDRGGKDRVGIKYNSVLDELYVFFNSAGMLIHDES